MERHYDTGKMTENRPPTPKNPARADMIAISGKQYAGKDVLADLLLERLSGFRKVPLAGAIKEAYARQRGLGVEEVERRKAEHRPGLIAMGDWGRKQDPDYWLQQVLAQPGKKIIPDVRLKREYDLLKSAGAFLIRLEASREIRSRRGTIVSEGDPTETQLDAVTDWDAVLTNNGAVDDLAAQLDRLLAL